MKTTKLDNSIKNKLKDRTIAPSISAWERLSVQLDEQPSQQQRGWFFYIGVAASILLLVSIGIQLFSTSAENIPLKNEIVEEPIEDVLQDPLEIIKNEIPVEKAIVSVDKVEEQSKKETSVVLVKNEFIKVKSTKKWPKRTQKTVVAQVEKHEINVLPTKEIPLKRAILKEDTRGSIKINSDDLLFAVTHSSKEVTEYYAKYNVSREEVLRTIQNELKKSNLKVNPNTILAEVERTISNARFENNFLKSLKKQVSVLATAIVSRND